LWIASGQVPQTDIYFGKITASILKLVI